MADDPNVLEQQRSTVPPEGDKGKEPPPEDHDPEGVVETRGQKFVPHGAFHEEREKRKALTKEVEELKKKAAKADELAGWVQTVQPHIEVLARHPEVAELLQKDPKALERIKPSGEGARQPEDDPDAEELAKDLGLYTEGGDLDTKRAQKLLTVIETRAGKIADKRVKDEVGPVRTTALSERAQSLRLRAYNAKDQEGQAYATKEAIDKAFGLIADAPELQADENVVRLMLVLARGMEGRRSSGDVTFTEDAGGRGNRPRPVSKIEEAAAKLRGKSVADFRKLSENESEVLE